MKLMILPKTDGDFPVNSYMLLKGDTSRIVIHYTTDDHYCSPIGGAGYDVSKHAFEGEIVTAVSFGWSFLQEGYGYEAREATPEELKTFLSFEEYHE